MLQQLTRERLQYLVKHPNFDSVVINDQKIIHSHNNGEPSFYVSVNVHAHGLDVFNLLGLIIPELQVGDMKPFQTEHIDNITFGSIARGRLEGADVTIWANIGEIPKEKAPTAMGATGENSHPNCTIDASKVEPFVDLVMAEKILINEGDVSNA